MFTSASHLITILLSIGSFLGLPYTPLSSRPTILLPGLSSPVATSSFVTFSPLFFRTSSTSSESTPASLPTSTKKQKLPTLVFKAPTFSRIPLEVVGAQAPPALPPFLSPIPVPTPIVTPPPANTTVEERASAAAVNVYCTSRSGNSVTIVTGSGITIDPRGVILTNAHVADHVLLNDYLQNPNSECIIRKGSPASPYYRTALLYISPAWIRLHGEEINNPFQSQETGEGDYAILAITSPIDLGSLPSTFAYLAPDTSTNSLADNTSVVAVGYPAGGYNGAEVMNNLLIQTDSLNIDTNYAFSDGGMDLIRTNSTSIASRGVSGGGIVNQSGQLIGLIATTVPNNNNPLLLDLQALTLSYLNNDLQRNTGQNLTNFLSRNLTSIANDFRQNSEPTLLNFLPH